MKRGQNDRYQDRGGEKRQSTGSSSNSQITTNYYPFNFSSLSAWHLHYVDFTKEGQDDKPSRSVGNFERRKNMERIVADNKELFQDYIFDGGMLLCPNEIVGDQAKGEKKVKRFALPPFREVDSPVTVDIEHVRVLGDNVQCLNQFVSLLLKRLIGGLKGSDGQKKYKNDGKNGWFEYGKAITIGDRERIKLWPGFRVNLSQFGSNFYLNLTIKHKVLHSKTVLQWFEDSDRSAVESELPFTIALTYSNEMHKIDAIDWDHHPTDTFERKEKGEVKMIQYCDYFKEKYGQTVGNLKQPLLVSYQFAGGKSKGKKIGELRFIPELCVRTGCTDDMRADNMLSREMIKSTAKRSHEYTDIIDDFVKAIPLEQFHKNHMNIEQNSCKLRPVMLDMPTIKYGGHPVTLSRDRPDYMNGPRNNAILNTYQLANWMILCKDERSVDQLKQHLDVAGRGISVTIGKPDIVVVRGRDAESWEESCETHLKESIQIVLVILPNKSKDIYKGIKNLCLNHGIASQCVVENNITGKRGLSIVTNVLLQISSKLGKYVSNVDNIHSLLPGVSMVCAIAKNSSVLTLTYSLAQDYNTVGSHSEELPSSGQMYSFPNFRTVWTKALNDFKSMANSLPPIVVLYREALSSGQIESVATAEIEAFYSAAHDVGYTSKPNLAYVTYNKTSSARFFSGDNNPYSGTCVDSSVVDHEHYDWYLIAHSCNQGVLTPTYYSIYNVKDVPENICQAIQKLTFQLCFQYNNWLGPIRIPAPAMYAEKASSFFHDVVRKNNLIDITEKMERMKLHQKMPYL